MGVGVSIGVNHSVDHQRSQSLPSAPVINPIRMIEKQQRAFFKQTGRSKPIMEILRESATKPVCKNGKTGKIYRGEQVMASFSDKS